MSQQMRGRRVGESVEDFCRSCKSLRRHTVMATGGQGEILRVICDTCGSQHNYRGAGERSGVSLHRGANERFGVSVHRGTSERPGMSVAEKPEPFPLVGDRERSVSAMSPESPASSIQAADLELLIRRIIREESGLTPVVPAEKWRGGEMVLRPGRTGLQEKSWPIETFFHKVVMLRNRLRVLEQQINSEEIPDDRKLKLQGYITGCYGTLTSFNILFAEEEDGFRGSGEPAR